MKPSDDDVLADLASLPAHDADRATAERVHRAAAAAFAEAHEHRGALHALAARAGRALTPVVLAGTIAVYLTWAVGAASALFH